MNGVNGVNGVDDYMGALGAPKIWVPQTIGFHFIPHFWRTPGVMILNGDYHRLSMTSLSTTGGLPLRDRLSLREVMTEATTEVVPEGLDV